ncbi:hypothetical protein HMPREF9629_00263 [Peptoanaerobacter stomatis]|uniref:Neutral zinc metallopeptidase n=1 Tax=Peptoanaerobacter stomatis TaxID=796937 RepID=G9X121_9FIRM|nr:zinc metallopeptidase [Peptoanaerobacter stomatis]EHL14714.1 hypothetical protein HMPREF9629_00263 [Peptoanaerobacter stomatis]
MPYYYGFGYDWTFILIIIGGLISMFASGRLKSTFSRYSMIRSASGMTGAQTARVILDANGLSNIRVVPIAGELTDHYDPRNKTISLSQSVMNSTSIAAVSVAAHECGHAVQDLKDYKPYLLRAGIVPIVNIGQNLAMPIFIAGIIFGSFNFLVPIGIGLFSLTLLFQIITLPVEFDASSRAFDLLRECNVLKVQEIDGSKKVLKAAALTYVAGVAASLLSVLRLIIIANSGRRRD